MIYLLNLMNVISFLVNCLENFIPSVYWVQSRSSEQGNASGINHGGD